jgi:hypothetical protein
VSSIEVVPTYAPVLILQDARVVKTVILTTGERWGSVVSLRGRCELSVFDRMSILVVSVVCVLMWVSRGRVSASQ